MTQISGGISGYFYYNDLQGGGLLPPVVSNVLKGGSVPIQTYRPIET